MFTDAVCVFTDAFCVFSDALCTDNVRRGHADMGIFDGKKRRQRNVHRRSCRLPPPPLTSVNSPDVGEVGTGRSEAGAPSSLVVLRVGGPCQSPVCVVSCVTVGGPMEGVLLPFHGN